MHSLSLLILVNNTYNRKKQKRGTDVTFIIIVELSGFAGQSSGYEPVD